MHGGQLAVTIDVLLLTGQTIYCELNLITGNKCEPIVNVVVTLPRRHVFDVTLTSSKELHVCLYYIRLT